MTMCCLVTIFKQMVMHDSGRMLNSVEYANNSLTLMRPFQCCLGYQMPLWLDQEEEVAVLLAQLFGKQ